MGDAGAVLPGAVLALDLGDQRIGVAVSDRRRILASPLTVLQRSGDRKAEHAAILKLVIEAEATVVVVGLPLSLSGARGPAARKALLEIEDLARELPVPVIAHDERLSSVEAHRRLRELRPLKHTSRSPATRKRDVIDDKAAAIMLESFLAQVAE